MKDGLVRIFLFKKTNVHEFFHQNFDVLYKRQGEGLKDEFILAL